MLNKDSDIILNLYSWNGLGTLKISHPGSNKNFSISPYDFISEHKLQYLKHMKVDYIPKCDTEIDETRSFTVQTR